MCRYTLLTHSLNIELVRRRNMLLQLLEWFCDCISLFVYFVKVFIFVAAVNHCCEPLADLGMGPGGCLPPIDQNKGLFVAVRSIF